MSVEHFLSATGHFGVLRLPEAGDAIAFIPAKERRPFRLTAQQLEQAAAAAAPDIPAIERRRFAARQLLHLRSSRVREETVQAPVLADGGYFPRVWRGLYDPGNPLNCYSPIDAREMYGSAYVHSVHAAASLFEELEGLFRYIEPSRANDVTYGHRIRELLILVCTELEASWRAIWCANNRGVAPKSLSTKQYVSLSIPLRLREWSVTLSAYPDYGPIQPFADWDISAPTQSLPWYDAYNATKHDRENNFQGSSLLSLVCAAAALHVQLSAQWGPQTFDRWHAAVVSPFRLRTQPVWSSGEIYSPRIDDDLSLHWNPVLLFG